MYVYILYSKKIDKYYIGQTELNVLKRLEQHNTFYFKNSFTKSGIPWVLYFEIACNTRKQAIEIENHIKRMKSRKFMENLTKYPLISQKMLNKYG